MGKFVHPDGSITIGILQPILSPNIADEKAEVERQLPPPAPSAPKKKAGRPPKAKK